MGTYNHTLFFDSVRASLFPSGMSQQQVDGMNALLAYIDRLEWVPGRNVDDPSENAYFHYWNAYNFATTFHETAFTMWPIEEYGKGRGKKYGVPDSQTGQTYYGRGFVQMTWKENYQRSDREIADGSLVSAETLSKLPDGKVNQTWHVEQALDVEIASCNLMIGCWRGWYTGRKLTHYLTNTSKDYINARRIVNGTDKANTIAGYAEKFESAFLASWQATHVEVPETELPPPMPPPGSEVPPEGGGVPEDVAEIFATEHAFEVHERRSERLKVVWRNRAWDVEIAN